MAHYFVGDIQGCDAALAKLLQQIDFSPSRDVLYPLGDLVNRGPESLATLRRLIGFGSSAQCILGNHDLHLLAASCGVRAPSKRDTLHDILEAPDAAILLNWVRQQPLVRQIHPPGFPSILMVHAGLLPQWRAQDALNLAQEVSDVLQSPDWQSFIRHMYGDTPTQWHDELQGADRLRVIVNACTRLRFCNEAGVMEFDSKESSESAPQGFMPWFEVTSRRSQDTAIAFGHWSTLNTSTHQKLEQKNIYALDTGCVWGGCLTALHWSEKPQRFSVHCDQAQQPG